ncbi:MAG TPA: phospholipase [Thermoanaerobaculia bacterium]|nr:phospholipase [Thermoanaerobaculia bacterium]
MSAADPHDGQPILAAGRPVGEARGAVVLVHGRGATAQGILSLVPELERLGLERRDLAWVAPQARGGSWYPRSFLAALADNEPWLGSALALVGRAVDGLAAAGMPAERTVLLGFSQGACLTCEYVARTPRRWGGVAALTGGILGPPGEPRSLPPDGAGDLAGTPAVLASGDPDPHVPWSRVEETAALLRRLGAEVTLQRHPGRPHTVSLPELVAVAKLLAAL